MVLKGNEKRETKDEKKKSLDGGVSYLILARSGGSFAELLLFFPGRKGNIPVLFPQICKFNSREQKKKKRNNNHTVKSFIGSLTDPVVFDTSSHHHGGLVPGLQWGSRPFSHDLYTHRSTEKATGISSVDEKK